MNAQVQIDDHKVDTLNVDTRNVEGNNDTARQRAAYYARISQSSLTPLWEVLGALVPKQPNSPAVGALWKYADIRDYVMEAGRLITAEEAERRVLILENPAMRGNSSITQTLYAGLQLILPGEIAPAHRHTQSALRLVLDGEGAYTAVDGERTTMKRGDFIITPAWTYHDHGNLGDTPVVWLDGLDIPLLRFFDAGFAEHGHTLAQSELRPEGDALARYGNNMLPMDFQQTAAQPTKVFVYPFARTRESLLSIARTASDPHMGHKLRFVNPATGASPMPTMGAFAQHLPAGFETQPHRSTDGTVYACLEGEGVAEINGQAFAFQPNDVFVVPSWHTLRLQARQDTILFSYSDRPAQQSLGLWREQKL
ncbi:gentisate 1,2-dioxygenase [Pigmentiphaga litoralis]|uniref:gentisate 1,2-dioxygenase n=1 Tax=Pigmentiphaga litoralis TaxID=516702 RepID=UPI003B4354C0